MTETKKDNSIKVQIIATVGVIIVALITIFGPKIFKGNEKPSDVNSSTFINPKPEPPQPQPIQKIKKESNSLSGVVMQNGIPVSRASISILNYCKDIKSGNTGEFEIILKEKFPKNGENLKITFSHPNYQTKSLNRTYYAGDLINLYFD